MTPQSPARAVAQRLSDLRTRGAQALAVLPDAQEWERAGGDDRRRLLDDLRVELYALSAILSYAVVRRAIMDRPSFPPYGLAQSKFSEWGAIRANPDPYEEGSIDSFHALWKALVDTMVLHLHGELTQRRRSPHAWTVDGLQRLLPVFAAGEDPDKRARKRDAITFVYGGLQFGTSVCVQLVEVGARTLRRHAPELSAAEQAAILLDSNGVAHRLAVLNLDQTLGAYKGLLSSAADTPEKGRDRPGWMDADRFTVRERNGSPWRVALRDVDDLIPADAADTRLGCPARIHADGAETPIGSLWGWSVELARDAGLLGPQA